MGRFNTLLDVICRTDKADRTDRTDRTDETLTELRERLARRKPRIMFRVKSHSAERFQKRLSKDVVIPTSR